MSVVGASNSSASCSPPESSSSTTSLAPFPGGSNQAADGSASGSSPEPVSDSPASVSPASVSSSVPVPPRGPLSPSIAPSQSGSSRLPSKIHDQASLTAAIASFRPTPHEVIGGIAPHVLDECRRPGSIRRRRRLSSTAQKVRPRPGSCPPPGLYPPGVTREKSGGSMHLSRRSIAASPLRAMSLDLDRDEDQNTSDKAQTSVHVEAVDVELPVLPSNAPSSLPSSLSQKHVAGPPPSPRRSRRQSHSLGTKSPWATLRLFNANVRNAFTKFKPAAKLRL